jgi:hypothetical protein
MNDDLDLLFERRLRSAFHAASLPPAPARLGSFLDDLPHAAGARRRSVPRMAAFGALAAGFAVVAFLAWGAIFGQGGFGPGSEPTPTPTPSPSASPSPSLSAASTTFTVYSVSGLLAGRTDGTVRGQLVDLYGWFSDFRGGPIDPCPTPNAAALALSCLDRRQGLVEAEATVGGVVDGRWVPTADPVVHPYWPPSLLSNPRVVAFFSVAPVDPVTPRPIVVLLNGHFEDALAADCPADASPPCLDRFVVDDVISFDHPTAAPTPAAVGTPFPFDSPPVPPKWMANCTKPRSQTGAEPGDPVAPANSSAGWVRKSQIPFEFVGSLMLKDVVYVAIIEGDFPLGDWREEPVGSGQRFRWWGTAACIADDNGMATPWLPGTTYKLFEDGHRVLGGDPFDPLGTPAP